MNNYRLNKETVNDIITEKQTKVHNKLYNYALSNYINKNYDNETIFYNTYKIIEKQNKIYYKPSSILLISLNPPFTIKEVDLSEYWPDYKYINETNNIDIIFINTKDNYGEYELIYIDYVRNKAKIINKYLNKIYTVDLNKIPNNIKINEYLKTNNSFTNLYKNIL